VSAFFDTNILVHAQQTGGKADRARALLADGGKLSVQVLNEFTAVSRRKQRRDWREITEAISDVLAVVDPPLALTLDLHAAARTLGAEVARHPLQVKLTLTVPSPCNSIATSSPALSHTVLTRLPVNTTWPARKPLPSAA
jgi:hypothetical protein